MKNLRLLPILALIFVLNVASTCDDDDNDFVPTLDATEVRNNIMSGSWRVTEFNDSGTDETNHFTGYNFTFANGGAISATNGTNTYPGTWSVTNNGSNSNSQSDLDFNIAFATPANFTELTEDWEINLYTANKIQLVHVSGGGGGTDYLTFEKN